MRVLAHHHKYGDVLRVADNEEQELWAFNEMFQELEAFDAYLDLQDEPDYTGWTARSINQDKAQRELYLSALRGDKSAARALCRARQHAEYEGWSFEEVKTPRVNDEDSDMGICDDSE